MTQTVEASQLINLPANDPATFTDVSVMLITIALVASYVPARRATRRYHFVR